MKPNECKRQVKQILSGFNGFVSDEERGYVVERAATDMREDFLNYAGIQHYVKVNHGHIVLGVYLFSQQKFPGLADAIRDSLPSGDDNRFFGAEACRIQDNANDTIYEISDGLRLKVGKGQGDGLKIYDIEIGVDWENKDQFDDSDQRIIRDHYERYVWPTLNNNRGLIGGLCGHKKHGNSIEGNQVMSNVVESDVSIEEIAPTEVCLRPIPAGITYPEGVVDPCQISGVVSWVTSIGALFNRDAITLSDGRVMRPGQYIIPPYQRKYTWSYDNVSQLCRDLLKSKDAGRESYHLGTVILHHQEGDGEDSFYVVDGQQRLTTISYLINCEIFASGASSPKIKNSDIKNILSALEEYREEKDHILEQLKRSTLVVIAVSDINEAFQLFSTQNGRGRPLTPANLLKAYHLHELEPGVNAAEEDKIWESNNAEKTPRDGRLLSQVLGEHLYRLRCWSRGEFPKEQFSNADIKEFKGITFKSGNVVGVPCQNLMRLRQYALSRGINFDYCSRSPNDGLNSLSAIDQHIVNGADFFEYMKSYAEAYRVLYMTTPAIDVLKEFREFYEEKCNYRRGDRRGDTYARHIFESLCLFCYDRFGADGLSACKRYLYRCAYYERAVKSRCYYGTCGSMYAVQAVRVMSACMTLADVKDRLHALNGEVLESYRNDKKGFSDKPTPDGVDCVRSVYEE